MFNFINLSDAKGLIPVALIALAGVAAYWLWSKAQANAASANSANATSVLTAGEDPSALENLALLSQLFGTSGSTTQLSSSQPTIQAGGQTTGSNAAAAPAPTTSGSSTGNTPVTQGV
jgi:predicted negative regulator of RcsB-dependent stress response